MTFEQLGQIVSRARCRVFGWEDAGNASHREVLATLIATTHHPAAVILCEPSLVRSTTRPPDVVVICPVAGVAVVEVKGVGLEEIEGIDPGGQFVIRYSSGARSRNPFMQARNAMFDIKNAAERAYSGAISLPFRFFVTMPRITRSAWCARWGENALCPPELLFAKDIPKLSAAIESIGRKRLEALGREHWPATELQAIHQGAFGDTSVLLPLPDERAPRRVRAATLGEMFDDAAEDYKVLSEDQQRLSEQYWETGPRVVRGVAGSGKTIVLANNLARRVQRLTNQGPTLFADDNPAPRILAVCFNRTLAPFIEKKVQAAYRQRTGAALPPGIVHACSFNTLMWNKAENGLWRYQKVFEKGSSDRARAEQYLRDLVYARENDPQTFDRNAYSAVYVDEGQDFLEEELRLLASLSRRNRDEPSVFIFYDDAQNLYGRQRPNWQSLGLRITGGRSHIMAECFRNTRQVLNVGFNVLYGSFAKDRAKVPTKAFGDIATLVEKGALESRDGQWNVLFAKREGAPPVARRFTTEQDENLHVLKQLRWLIHEQEVRSQDILILSMKKDRIERLATFVAKSGIDDKIDIHIAFKEKDELLGQRNRLTFSTVASAKGYDAYCVIIVSVNDFKPDVDGRASFYVGCSRAIEYLELSGSGDGGLMDEVVTAVESLDREMSKVKESLQ